jgi:hypothetical protein
MCQVHLDSHGLAAAGSRMCLAEIALHCVRSAQRFPEIPSENVITVVPLESLFALTLRATQI